MIRRRLTSVSFARIPTLKIVKSKRDNVESIGLVSLIALIFLMPLPGCTVTLSPDAAGMKAVSAPTESEARACQYYEKIVVGKVSIEETGHDPYRNIVIEQHELRQALEGSLAAAHLLAGKDTGEDQYILNATVIKTPLGEESGMLTITAYIEYVLVDRQSGMALFKETIAGWDRARFGSSPNFHEHAIRNNIERLLSRLTAVSETNGLQE